jgi:FdhE protein
MSFVPTGKANYRARIERAELLLARYPAAKQILSFYVHIATFQKDFYERLPKLWGKRAVVTVGSALRSELNLTILLDPFKQFLHLIESHSPGPLSTHAHEVRMRGEFAWQDLLTEFWQEGLIRAEASEPLTEFLARGFLQPYAEFVAAAQLPPSLPMTVCRCPRCDALPAIGVLRREGDGGKRFLLCSFCSQEWDFRRILCANCGEEQEKKLPVYVAEQFPHVRVECCDSCKHFLRTIDLTRDGHAVPIVDDLAAIPLSLWAEENGYTRIQGNLLGT